MIDFDVPKRYGLRQTIADTLGVGGIMRGLRTIPVLLDVCRDLEAVSPGALVLNYVNPMAMLCWAAAEASPVRMVGLCHSIQHTASELAADLGLPAEELDYLVAGINHLAFFLRLERGGEDLYPALSRLTPPDLNRVRYEVLKHFGSFVTESSEHFAEYVPWFIKDGRPDLIERFNIPLDEYPRRCERNISEWSTLREELEQGADVGVERSAEYGAHIVRACETGEPFTFNGNVPNRRAGGGLLIDNLPADCCVEVPCVASAERDRAAGGRRPAARARGLDADQRQCPGARRGGRADGTARARVPRGDARSAHGGRAVAGRDRRAGRRPARGARGLDPAARRLAGRRELTRVAGVARGFPSWRARRDRRSWGHVALHHRPPG